MSKIFYVCEHCGNIIEKVKDSKVPVFCCGQKMKELTPNTVEASGEKHIPVVGIKDDVVRVNVGSEDHPMFDVHYIEWIYLETENGGQIRYLKPGEAPAAAFFTGGEKPVAVYAYCNLHGLWKTEL